MPVFSAPILDLVKSCVTIKHVSNASGHVIIEQATVERFLKETFSSSIDRKVSIEIKNVKSVIVMLRKFTKPACRGTMQRRTMLKKAARRKPIKVRYCLVENDAKVFIRELQKTIYDLEIN